MPRLLRDYLSQCYYADKQATPPVFSLGGDWVPGYLFSQVHNITGAQIYNMQADTHSHNAHKV